MSKVKILFQGDSITDGCRNLEDCYDLGSGYVKYATELLTEKYQETEFEFINLGIRGHATGDILKRIQTDFIDVQPDIVSLMIGINDVIRHYHEKDDELMTGFEERYRCILSTIKEKMSAKLMVIEPFLTPLPSEQVLRGNLNNVIEKIRRVALEYADVYLPIDGLFYSEFIKNNYHDYTTDGIHLSPKGAQFLGEKYVDYVEVLLD